MKKRTLALIMALVLMLSVAIPGTLAVSHDNASAAATFSVAAEEDAVALTTESIALVGRDDPQTVTAYAPEGAVATDGELQWQINIPNTELWANIGGDGKSATSLTLTVNYGLVANLLTDGQVTLRCHWTPKSGEELYSNDLTVSYTEAEPEADAETETEVEPAAEPAQEQRPVVLSARARVLRAPGESEVMPLALEPEQTEQTEQPAETPVEPTQEPAPTADPTATPEVTETPETGTTPAADIPVVQAATDTPATVAEGDVKQTYNIVITYKFENNEIVSDPYTANLAEGSSFSATVTFPTVQGYLPYVGETQQNSIELNYPSISEDVTIDVVYKPTNVNYTVIHYQQNVGDDGYTVKETETKQGLTKSNVPDVHKTYEGFYNLLYEKPAIAADGSTVIEVYYDRYYYLMNFDMDGGYGTEPVYARYGASIGTVANPTKAGYTFGGWAETKGGTTAVTLPATMPAENKTYHAIWTPDATAKVTVVFWGENADDEGYSYLADQTKEIYLAPGTTIQYDGTGLLTCGVHNHDANCYKLTCTQVPHKHTDCTLACTHTHTTACYSSSNGLTTTTQPTQTLTDQGNGIYTYSDGSMFGSTHYFVKIGDQWYCGQNRRGDASNTQSITFNCSHVHGDTCYTCGKAANDHRHTDYTGSCYALDCDKTTHTHTNSCYTALTGVTDTTKWKFVKSDTITVAADGSSVVNVYYDRVEYSVQFYEDQNCSSNREYTSLKITAKWGENIQSKWPTYNGSSSWYVKDKSNTWQNSIQVMPVGGAKFWGPKSGSSKYTATYYVEILDGEEYNVSGNDGRYYKVHHTDTSNSSGNVTDEERYGIDGFTINNSISTSNGSNYGGSKFYYTRNSYKLTFNDQYNDVKNETVKFEAPLSTYKDYVPEVPSAYEPGSVEFGGWYQNPQCTGEEYKLEEHKMPANDIILYAKWVPVKHTVTFYLDKEAYDAGTTLGTHPAITVPHGELADPTPAEPTKGSYEFVGWFYMDNGEEKAFDFANMQVRKDLDVYGKWSSNTLKEYTVQYVLKSDHSVKVADDLTGSGLAGTTKTFDAKGGTELYNLTSEGGQNYQEGYFPTVQSQSLLLDIESNSLVITFEYVPMEAVPYTVRYVTAEEIAGATTYTVDGKTYYSLADDKVVSDNRKAVVTETFQPISGYMPDAYQKRLVVTADGENILYFYYTKDTEHAYYKITHYIQNTDGATWAVHAESQAIGDIGTRYTASPMTIPGYTYDHIEYVVNEVKVTDITSEGAVLTADGLEINLYYVRNEYPYQVRYLEQGTGTQLADPKNSTGKYGQVISESAIDIDGYEVVGNASQTLNIRIEEGTTAQVNIITFYYKQLVEIKYVAVGPEGVTNFGSVSPTSEKVTTTGTAQGSTPTAGDGFKFVGWFTDEDCTTAVDATWVTDNKLTPQKDENGKNVAATYYAKFDYDITSLTITKTLDATVYNKNDSFVFTVKGEGLPSEGLKVVIQGEGSKTISGLKVGATYTVTEDTKWSWRYDPDGGNQKTATLVADANSNKVTFSNKKINDKWLDGSTAAVNEWKDGKLQGTDSNANN